MLLVEAVRSVRYELRHFLFEMHYSKTPPTSVKKLKHIFSLVARKKEKNVLKLLLLKLQSADHLSVKTRNQNPSENADS